MFTGLIQTTGTIEAIDAETLKVTWTPSSPASFRHNMAIGDSIAVDGICLTVTKILSDSFLAAISPETSQRTILGSSRPNAVVNLESSLRVGSKIGGHFVTGHIDGVGYFQSSTQTANAWEMRFAVPDPRVARYIVPKGSIAVNGISLTVADCDRTGAWFTVAVIPLTYAETNLHALTSDSPVNLEGDVLGKYVEKFLRIADPMTAVRNEEALEKLGAMGAMAAKTERDRPSLTPDFLTEHGYG